MASWQEIASSEPEFAASVQARFDMYKHKVIATLRKDGSPRISGIEAEFRDGQLFVGMMPGSLKSRDVLRDPRIALHSGTEDPPETPTAGDIFDAKLSGRAIPAEDVYFRIDIDEVVMVSLGDTGDHLLISHWRPGTGLTQTKRY